MSRAYNSTIRIKTKPCIRCGKDSRIFSKGRCEPCARIENTMALDEKEVNRVIQEEDLSGLIEDADTIFSRFIRLKYANERGMVKCYTCPTVVHWTMIQNGHYISRSHLYLRWDERNCRPQCRNCNEAKYGEHAKFMAELEKESPGLPEYLYDDMKIVHKTSREEIREIIATYTPKVKELKRKLIVP